MSVDVNYLGVLLAAASSMVVGSIWYSQGVFGRMWAKLAGIKMDGKMSGNLAPLLLTQLGLSLLTAYVLAHFVVLAHRFYASSWTVDALNTAFWAWLGFTACRLATHDMFEGRRKKLTLLNSAHELVTLLVMALVLAWVRP